MIKRDFFISYSRKNEDWAQWIAKTLQQNGYSVYLQAWDIVPGDDFMSQMRTFLQCSKNCIAVVSESYWESKYCKLEFSSAYNAKLNNRISKLIPIRVEDVSMDALYDTIVHVDLFDMDEKQATRTLLRSVKQEASIRWNCVFPKIRKGRRVDLSFPRDAGQANEIKKQAPSIFEGIDEEILESRLTRPSERE